MPENAAWQEPVEPSRARRTGGRALVFAAVLVAAGLLGRLGSGVGDGPALEVERSPGDGASAPSTTAADAAGGSWERLPDPGMASRDAHTAVWSGGAVLVWGGYGPFGSGDGRHVDGVAYDVAEGGWSGIPPAPLTGLVNHTAVWTGPSAGEASPVSWSHGGGPVTWPAGEMIVWSGGTSGQRGAAYDPASGQWRAIAADPLPDRQFHTAVWTGPRPDHPGEMIVWGGYAPQAPTGAAYDPAADRWRVLSDGPGPGPRVAFTATWTGREMVVVGGADRRRDPAAVTALAYDPAGDAWRVLPDPPGGPRRAHTAVWSGAELLVWGGVGPDGRPVRPAGVSYDPDADAWTALPDAPDGSRAGHAAVWAGDRLVVWGGVRPQEGRSAGLTYDPAERVWSSLEGPAVPRVPPRLVWTGEALIVLDGRSLSRALLYTPPAGATD